MEFREHRLDNGLEIIAECNPDAYSTALGFFVRTGARATKRTTSPGSATSWSTWPSRARPRVRRRMSTASWTRSVRHSNAFTSEEQTVYYAAVLPECQDRAVEMLSDILRPSLREEDFDMEKQVILEEIAKYEDQPPFGAAEKCMAVHFGDHPLARSVPGHGGERRRPDAAPDAAVLSAAVQPAATSPWSAAGHVDFERLVRERNNAAGAVEPVSGHPGDPAAPPRRGSGSIPKASAVQQYVVQIANGPAAEDDDRYAGRLLATILGDDSGSRMFWELVDTGLAECAS